MAPIIREKIEFIVWLAEPEVAVPPEFMLKESPPDFKEQGYIVSGALSSFVENVNGPAKEDILNAILFAQLTSDNKYNRNDQKMIADW